MKIFNLILGLILGNRGDFAVVVTLHATHALLGTGGRDLGSLVAS